MLKRPQLIESFKHIQERQLEIMIAKNSDYSSNEDALKNFRSSELIWVPAEQAILVRMMDKMSRIWNLLTKEAEVKDESIQDTLLDLSNYAILLSIMRTDNTTNS